LISGQSPSARSAGAYWNWPQKARSAGWSVYASRRDFRKSARQGRSSALRGERGDEHFGSQGLRPKAYSTSTRLVESCLSKKDHKPVQQSRKSQSPYEGDLSTLAFSASPVMGRVFPDAHNYFSRLARQAAHESFPPGDPIPPLLRRTRND
jgi:hypothetical protein